MNSVITRWSIRLLIKRRDQIDLTPAYQRGPAWTSAQKSLLIDSLFRGLEVPLIFLAGPAAVSARRDVIDGQQRLRAIYEFVVDGTVAVYGDAIGRKGVAPVTFRELTEAEKEQFLSRKIAICSLNGISAKSKRLQFERLQLGQHLKPVELRNAMASAAPIQIRSIAETHAFFEHSGIPDRRYKREDYLTHLIAVCSLSVDGAWRDIKAPTLRKFVQDSGRGIDSDLQKAVDGLLTCLANVASIDATVFRNKWSFVDAGWFFYKRPEKLSAYTPKMIAQKLATIESNRKRFYRNTEDLLDAGGQASYPHSRALYTYIMAYKSGGAVRQNIEARQRYFELIFK